MKKRMASLCLMLLAVLAGSAQSKVFKEVSDEISSTIRAIKQDNALVGYLVFTQLEKTSADSFNYRVTIMDENLNDIGKLTFRDESLDLQAVAFDQDVLCLAFLKSNVLGKLYKNKKDYNTLTANPRHAVVTRFLNLDGTTIKTNSVNADVPISMSYGYSYKPVVLGKMAQGIQLSNVSGKGFACFYGDENDSYLTTYDATGKELWKKPVGKADKGFYLLSSTDAVYLLSKKKSDKLEGGYEVTGYGFGNKTVYDKYVLKDKQGASLKVLSFENDPITGKPYITGTIINPERNGLYVVKDITRMPYTGVFTIALNGPKRSDIKETFSYWAEGDAGFVTEKGKFMPSDAYSLIDQGYKDSQGNTYFVGSSVVKKTRWGTIATAVVLSPLIVVSPFIIGLAGTSKYKTTDAFLIKQSPAGKMSYETTIDCNATSFVPGRSPIGQYGPRKSFYRVSNATTKSDYIIVDDVKDIVIYNATQKKVARTISHKDGSTRINVYPAKEGHVMVTEYNQRERSTRFSIESL